MEEELGWSLVLLDLCNAMQENFIEMMMKVQELLFSLKRGDDAAAQLKAYIQITNKAHKQFKKVSVLEYTSCLLCKQIEMPKRSLISKAF